jgi:hypothetical protein
LLLLLTFGLCFQADKASMLDEIIDYVKFLQLQVKVLSMSRLGGAAAVAPLVADMSSEVPLVCTLPHNPYDQYSTLRLRLDRFLSQTFSARSKESPGCDRAFQYCHG